MTLEEIRNVCPPDGRRWLSVIIFKENKNEIKEKSKPLKNRNETPKRKTPKQKTPKTELC